MDQSEFAGICVSRILICNLILLTVLQNPGSEASNEENL